MAKSQTKSSPPTPVPIPKPIATIVEAFSIDSEKDAKALLKQAAKAVYAGDGCLYSSTTADPTEEEIDCVYNLMKALKPQDALETLTVAQIIVGHMLGMTKLSQSFMGDQILGLKLLKLSNEAMDRLERKRNGGRQNIQITYNNAGPAVQALIAPLKGGEQCQ